MKHHTPSPSNVTAVTTTAGKLVDAVVYGTGDPDATALIAALTAGKPQVNEGAGSASETVSISRLPNGVEALSGGSFGGVTVTLAEVLWDDTTAGVNIYQVNATVTVGTPATLFVRVVAKN